METVNNLLSGKSCYILLFDTMGSAWLGEHVEFRDSWQVVLFTGETGVPVAVDKWLLPLFFSGILLLTNMYCLLKSTHPLLHCLGYNSHGRPVFELTSPGFLVLGDNPILLQVGQFRCEHPHSVFPSAHVF